MNAKEDLVEKNARKLSREERFNDETEASASRRRRRTTRFSVASRAKIGSDSSTVLVDKIRPQSLL